MGVIKRSVKRALVWLLAEYTDMAYKYTGGGILRETVLLKL